VLGHGGAVLNEEQETLPAGTQIDAFEIVSLLGRGGMGAVYKAVDRSLDRYVALKTVERGITDDPVSLERFRREAKAASSISHPNVVSIFGFGVRGNLPYMVMEMLRGQSLADLIATGPLSVERTADIFLGVCAGLYAAHQHGIVHRDLKPPNVFLTKTWLGETAKILDFGISKGVGSADLTDKDHIIGSPFYFSPEQVIRGRIVDARADQFSMGVMLFQCVTGRLPYKETRLADQFDELRRGRFIRPTAFRPDLPPAFESVIAQAMTKDPEGRFSTAREFGRALLPFASINSQRKWSEHYVAYNASFNEHAPSSPHSRPRQVPPTSQLPSLDETAVDPVTELDASPAPQFPGLGPSGPVPHYRPEFNPAESRRAADAVAAATGGTKLLDHDPVSGPPILSAPAHPVPRITVVLLAAIAALGGGAVLLSLLR
jgi:serine/threonine protein kinase